MEYPIQIGVDLITKQPINFDIIALFSKIQFNVQI